MSDVPTARLRCEAGTMKLTHSNKIREGRIDLFSTRAIASASKRVPLPVIALEGDHRYALLHILCAEV